MAGNVKKACKEPKEEVVVHSSILSRIKTLEDTQAMTQVALGKLAKSVSDLIILVKG